MGLDLTRQKMFDEHAEVAETYLILYILLWLLYQKDTCTTGHIKITQVCAAKQGRSFI